MSGDPLDVSFTVLQKLLEVGRKSPNHIAIWYRGELLFLNLNKPEDARIYEQWAEEMQDERG